MISAQAALDQLREGNRRFVAAEPARPLANAEDRQRVLAEPHAPLAVLLGCSDARVSPEILFDQGLGDLFVIRVAGNIAGPSQVGSVEFATHQLGARLVVVLGHSNCSMVRATLDSLMQSESLGSPDSDSLRDIISPAFEELLESDLQRTPEGLLQEAVRANVLQSVEKLRHGSAILGQLAREDGLRIVGAEYSLESGTVDFFETGSLPA